MKSTNANRFYLLFSILIITACQYRPEEMLISGSWKYISVTRDDASVIPVTDGDFMHLNSDSSFEYHIQSVKKNKKGTWTYTDHTLHLRYDSQDTTRHFEIDLLAKYRLQFHEGKTIFSFSRID